MINTLQKIQRLEQYVAVIPSTEEPFLDLVFSKVMARERNRLEELRERLSSQLTAFEKQYARSSPDFYNRYESGQLDDAVDFVEWAATVEMTRNIEQRLMLLNEDAA